MALQDTALTALSCAALLIMAVLIRENARMRPDSKRRLYQTYCIIIATNIVEAAGLWLNGTADWTHTLHLLIKCLDYCLSPCVGYLFVRQIRHEGDAGRALPALLAANVCLEIASIFTGWIYYVDAGNYYHHGPLYLLYILIYGTVTIFAAWQFILYSHRFKSRNRLSLQMIMVFVIAGIAAQEMLGARVLNVTLTIGAILLFIHNNEYAQQDIDSTISEQRAQLETDALTGMRSRFAYHKALTALDEPNKLPEGTVVFMIDINGLKQVNDQYGHSAGDQLICGIAQCISQVLSPHGECYRTGGDEFVAILHGLKESAVDGLRDELIHAVNNLSGEIFEHASISYGHARADEFPDKSAEELVRVADDRMYWQKAQYYQTSGRDRRKR